MGEYPEKNTENTEKNTEFGKMLTINGKPADAIKAAKYIKDNATEPLEVDISPRSKNSDDKIVTVKKDRTTISFYDVEDIITDVYVTSYHYLIVTTYGHQSAMDI